MLLDRLSIHKSTIGTSQVLKKRIIEYGDDHRVLARYRQIINLNVIVRFRTWADFFRPTTRKTSPSRTRDVTRVAADVAGRTRFSVNRGTPRTTDGAMIEVTVVALRTGFGARASLNGVERRMG